MDKPTRILILTQYFPPETGAPQARLSEMARRLAKRGFEVEVLTALPNYPQGRVYEPFRGKLYATSDLDGIRVIHAPIYPSRSARMIPRLLSYFSFVFCGLFFGLFFARRPNVLICESPPLFLGLAAMFLKTVRRCYLIFNVSDLWPESAVRMGLHCKKPLVALATALEVRCYRSSDAVTGQSWGIVRGVQAKCPEKRVELIPNGCDCQRFQPDRRCKSLRDQYGVQDKIVVGYAGLLGVAQGIGAIVEIADRLRENPRIHFLIAGDGPEREQIERRLQERQLPNVSFTGWLDRDQMPAMVASFDIGFVPLRYYIPGALPSKIYETMACQTPVVLACKGGDPQELLERAGAGICIDYDDNDAIAGAVAQLANDTIMRQRMGELGRQYVLKHHERRLIADRLASLVDEVTGKSNRIVRNAA